MKPHYDVIVMCAESLVFVDLVTLPCAKMDPIRQYPRDQLAPHMPDMTLQDRKSLLYRFSKWWMASLITRRA